MLWVLRKKVNVEKPPLEVVKPAEVVKTPVDAEKP